MKSPSTAKSALVAAVRDAEAIRDAEAVRDAAVRDAEAVRDTAEFPALALSRLRELDPAEDASAPDYGDRDTVELSVDRASELARESGRPRPGSPAKSGEIEKPRAVPQRAGLAAHSEAEPDREALFTIPAPPPFETED